MFKFQFSVFHRHHSVLFFGTDEFSIHHLKALQSASFITRLETVVPPTYSLKTKKHCIFQIHLTKGPMYEYSFKHQIPMTLAPPLRNQWHFQHFQHFQDFDFAVVVSFGYFLPLSILQMFKKGALNVHPSLLPKYRGATPIQSALLENEKETGVSIIELDPFRFDAGKILKQSHVTIPPLTHYWQLHALLAQQGSLDLLETLQNFSFYKKHAKIQDESLVTKASKLELKRAQVHFHLQCNETIERIHRAIGYKYPLFTFFNGKMIQLLEITCTDSFEDIGKHENSPPGSVYLIGKPDFKMFIKAQKGWICVNSVKVAGKKQVGIKDFINGYQLPTGLNQPSFSFPC